jgi:hypothetical protein
MTWTLAKGTKGLLKAYVHRDRKSSIHYLLSYSSCHLLRTDNRHGFFYTRTHTGVGVMLGQLLKC